MLFPECLAGITEESKQSSALLQLEKVFYLDFLLATLLLIISILCWTAIGR
jgi:cell division protein FtsL